MLLQVNASTRKPSNNRSLRRNGQIPATVYGHKGADSISITLDEKEATTLLREATINNTMIEVNVTDGDFKGRTLLREVQNHPYKKEIYHLSFFAIESQSKIEVDIPLHFVGVPVGVKVGGGSVDTIKNYVRVSCSPNNVPESFELDIAPLEIGKGIHVSEIAYPEGVKPVTEGTALVVTILKK
ncbi:50S ribosomal protein L25 [Pseudanabaena sp. FACHB-1998]|uniref:50S ribosomal protein L25 n=1 Tax=Pseudanabaena sp. FACHB-1998 TaxID=2692858 RepID=UPI00168110EA|nr:50S ribosomal protein L25 [Pseudanabaena sp. FACHB-1998]MBD2175740.1 50S ribosomal protein L25 [Pseudanabaena sp. FACHB-1998]